MVSGRPAKHFSCLKLWSGLSVTAEMLFSSEHVEGKCIEAVFEVEQTPK